MAVLTAAARPLEKEASLRDRWLWAACAAYAALYFVLGTMRYAAHRNFVDLGIFTQTAVSAFGCFCNTIEGSHWAMHFSPILYIPGAIMQVWRSPLALVAVSSIAGALTAPPVYGLVRRRADRKAARLAAAVVLLYPPLAGVVFNDFHENAFAPAAVAWTAWALDGGFTVLAFVFAALVVAIKEDQIYFLAIAALFAQVSYLRQKDEQRRDAAGVIAAFALLLGLSLFWANMFMHHTPPQWSGERFYAWTAEDWRALFPLGIGQRLYYLALVFLPMLFLPFRTPVWWIMVPGLLEVLLSRMSTTFTVGSHYTGAWLGYGLYAFAAGIGVAARKDLHRVHRALYWCIALCIVEFATANPLHPHDLLRPVQARDVALDRFLQGLPPNISVATQEEAYTHLAARNPNATLLPEISDQTIRSCYVLIDRDYPDSPRLVESGPLVQRLISSGNLVLQRRSGAIELYRCNSRLFLLYGNK